jgi:very-short-patch-repair endonuclease
MPQPPLLPGAESRLSVDNRHSGFARRELEVARLAAEFEGVLDLDELRSCGLSTQAVSRRARQGRLHRLHEGVYAVGHPNVSQRGRFIAAVKACGPDAALSHRAEAARSGFRAWRGGDVEVTIPGTSLRVHPGIRVHRSSLMTRNDQMVRDGILVTNATWTVVALAAVLKPDDLRGAVREALGLKLVSVRGLLALLHRLGPVRGARRLRRILARSALPTRSELEDVVYDLIISGGFAPPEVNTPLRIEGRTVIPDFRWPEQRLVVEADGARWHDNALARADDAERQALLERHGETVLRVDWDEAILRGAGAQKRFALAGVPLL